MLWKVLEYETNSPYIKLVSITMYYSSQAIINFTEASEIAFSIQRILHLPMYIPVPAVIFVFSARVMESTRALALV